MKNQIEIYQASDGQTKIEVTFEQGTVWLTNAQLVEHLEHKQPTAFKT